MINNLPLNLADHQLFSLIDDEINRQEEHIELIASENYVSQAILDAAGTILTNKYAEGYPNKRYYGGCEHVDKIEQLAIDRAKKLFGAEYANVQPHSGSQANHAILSAFLSPGDLIMGMDLAHGGHLTHGSPANLSGKLYKVISYKLNENEEIDYDALENLAIEHKPKMIIGGASAYALKFDWQRMREIADKVNAILFVDMAHYAGLIAAGVYPSPIPFADVIGSTTHKTLRGPRGGLILAKEKYAKLLDSAIFPRSQGGPLLHIIAAKAVCFLEAMQQSFIDYQKQVVKNASAMVNAFQNRGFKVVSNRTESHLLMLDVTKNGLNGKEAENLLAQANITVNKNAIPNDTLPAHISSGIRLGSPAMTTRGFKEEEFIIIANIIADLFEMPNDSNLIKNHKLVIKQLTEKFPAYQEHILKNHTQIEESNHHAFI